MNDIWKNQENKNTLLDFLTSDEPDPYTRNWLQGKLESFGHGLHGHYLITLLDSMNDDGGFSSKKGKLYGDCMIASMETHKDTKSPIRTFKIMLTFYKNWIFRNTLNLRKPRNLEQ